jgi:hypothetical protein
LVVLGGPGTGKSALLGHLLVAADPVLAAIVPTNGPRPQVGSVDIAIHVKGLTCDDVVERLASAAAVEATDPEELLVAVREAGRSSQRPLTVLVDAVEEAVSVEEAQHIATLLRKLADTRAVRVLAGVRTAAPNSQRARVVQAFGRTTSRIDLESRQFLRNYDIVEYVERRLVSEDTGGSRYRDRPPDEIRTIARAVARKARYNFLIAQLTSRWLANPNTPSLDLTAPAWDQELPETIGQAMDTYLDTCGPDTALVRRLLSALAFARGDGLSRDQIWLTIADALHPGFTHTRAELDIVFDSAANYLVERTNNHHGLPSYRLYHDALDEHLRDQCSTQYPQRAIVAALIDMVPIYEKRQDWASAHTYTRAYLAGHAVHAYQLDNLLSDVNFLVYSEPGPLLAVLGHVTTEHARLTAAVYRTASHVHRRLDPSERCRILALNAARFGAVDLQQRLHATHEDITPTGLRFHWRVRFAAGANLNIDASRIVALIGHTDTLQAIAIAELDRRSVAITSSTDETVRIWDLTEQRQIGQPLTGHTGAVTAVATAELDGRPIVVTTSRDETVRIWDLTEQRQIGLLRGHAGTVSAVATTELDSHPIAITSGEDSDIRVWDQCHVA